MHIHHYVVQSLELHLFFGRIMKEDSLFLRAGFTPADPECSAKAEFFMGEFEELLSKAVTLSDGVVIKEVLSSGEIVTEFTELAEKQTHCFTTLPINRKLTCAELALTPGDSCQCCTQEQCRRIRSLNQTALRLLDGLIDLKETVLRKVLQCEIFTLNYPLLIEHILREAKLYRKYVEILEREGELNRHAMRDTERFWNQIMMEHAWFIRGLLDPCEAELICAADDFGKKFCSLLEASRNAHCKTMREDSLSEAVKFRDFKAAGAAGIQQCRIRSVILPLLADHVLREANHYIRLLEA